MALHLTERAAIHGEVLGVDVHGPPIDLAVAGHDALAHVLVGRQPHLVVGLVRDVRFQLVECARIEQQGQPLAGGKLALGVLCGDARLATALPRALAHGAQLQNTGVFLRHRNVLD